MSHSQDEIPLAAAGDPGAFDAIVRRYGDRLYRSAFMLARDAEDARDVVQETFLEAYRALRSFEGRSDPYTWLYRIMLRRLGRLRRREGRRCSTALDADGRDTPDAAPGPADVLERQDAMAKTQAAIAELPESHRTVVVMKYYEDFSSGQIALALGLSQGRVRARLSEARRQLREKLAPDADLTHPSNRGDGHP